MGTSLILLILNLQQAAFCCFGFICVSLNITGTPNGSFDFFIEMCKIQVINIRHPHLFLKY